MGMLLVLLKSPQLEDLIKVIGKILNRKFWIIFIIEILIKLQRMGFEGKIVE